MSKKHLFIFLIVFLLWLGSCDPVTYVVTFDSNGGGDVEPIDVFYNRTVQLPEVAKEGYTFMGWYTGETINDSQFTNSSVVTGNLTLYARWELNTYTITYVPNKDVVIHSQTLTYGSSITHPTEPFVQGYIFDGWYLDENYQQPFDILTMPANDIVVYARWIITPLEPHDYCFTGQFAGWGDAVGDEDYQAEEISITDSRLSSISDLLVDVAGVFILEITFPSGEAGWTMTYKIDGVEHVFDGNLSIKLIRTNVDDEIPNWWGQSPESGAFISLTPDTLYIPPFVEENIDQKGGWNDNPVAFAPGVYDAVYVIYANGTQGMALIPK